MARIHDIRLFAMLAGCLGALMIGATAARAQCYGVWAQAELGHIYGGIVYDSLRNRMVLHCANALPGQAPGAAGGTWSWDGVRWSRLAWDGPWPQRTGFALAYDPGRDRVVLFGGTASSSGTPALRDTWEFDGTHWRLVADDGPEANTRGTLTYVDAWGAVMFSPSGMKTLWLWDGVRWSVVPATGTPPTGAIVYDSLRERVVRIGDFSTWGFDGSTWTQLTNQGVSYGPNPATVTYDSGRDRVQTGMTGATCAGYFFEFNGQSWSQPPTPFKGPLGPMAYHPQRGTSVMFGGQATDALCFVTQPDFFNSTWEWNGSAWTKWADNRPHWAEGAVAAFDAAFASTVVVPGTYMQGDGEVSHRYSSPGTWLWNSEGWTEMSHSLGPPKRDQTALVYDSLRERLVLFGGKLLPPATTTTYGDTWAFDGGWTLITNSGPGPTSAHSMAYDPLRDRVVMFKAGPQTWELNDSTWTQVIPSGASPSSRNGSAMVFDPVSGKVRLFGGYDGSTNLNDLWSWDGSAWTQLTQVGTLPSPRSGHTLTADPQRGVILMTGFSNLQDTWEWNGTSWTQVGAGAPSYGVRNTAYDPEQGFAVMYVRDAIWQWMLPQAPVFADSPHDTEVIVGRTAILECTTEQVGPVTFQWRKDGVPVVDDGRIRGSHTMRLVFEQAALEDNGCYDVVCTGGCGSATSEIACIGVFCHADYNQDGFVDPLDYNLFINLFEANDMGADFNDDGFLDPLDYNGFINAFEAGC